MGDYIRLSEPPIWCIQYPTCGTCCVDLETDCDGWTCPVCGTAWPMSANDGDRGDLYADWSGDEPTGPACTEDEAARWGDYHVLMERHRILPEFCPEPKRPDVKRATP